MAMFSLQGVYVVKIASWLIGKLWKVHKLEMTMSLSLHVAAPNELPQVFMETALPSPCFPLISRAFFVELSSPDLIKIPKNPPETLTD